MDKLIWSKGLFKTKLTITRNNDQVGVIDWDNFLSSEALATINGRRFLLNREFFLSKLEISDATNQASLGILMRNNFV